MTKATISCSVCAQVLIVIKKKVFSQEDADMYLQNSDCSQEHASTILQVEDLEEN